MTRTVLILLLTTSFSVVTAPGVYGQQSTYDVPARVAGGGGGWSFNDSETCLLKHINWTRRKHGLRELNWDRQLGYVARRHSKSMAASRDIFHDGNLEQEVTRWRALGQNSGQAPGCKKAFWAFMHSSSHRANILGRWKHVGVGTDRSGGCIWVQIVFETRYDPGNIYHYP